MVTEFPETVVAVRFVPPLMLYVKIKGAVPIPPVNVMEGEGAFKQTVVSPAIVAVGKGETVTGCMVVSDRHPTSVIRAYRTLYTPGAAYAWEGLLTLEKDTSPKSQYRLITGRPPVFELSIN